MYEGVPLDRKVLDIIEFGATDDEYTAVLQVLHEGEDLRGLGDNHPAKAFHKVWGKLSTFNGPNGQALLIDGKLVIPWGLRADTLSRLHQFHPS